MVAPLPFSSGYDHILVEGVRYSSSCRQLLLVPAAHLETVLHPSAELHNDPILPELLYDPNTPRLALRLTPPKYELANMIPIAAVLNAVVEEGELALALAEIAVVARVAPRESVAETVVLLHPFGCRESGELDTLGGGTAFVRSHQPEEGGDQVLDVYFPAD